jgi:hypothetical protein
MILKRKEQEGVVKAIYSSSNICASTYNNVTNDLTLIFTYGGQYLYKGVSKTDYTRFEIADSQGSILNTHIKKYSSEKLGGIDVTEMIKEIKELELVGDTSTPESRTKELLEAMNTIIGNYFKNGNVTKASLKGLKDNIINLEKISANNVTIV